MVINRICIYDVGISNDRSLWEKTVAPLNCNVFEGQAEEESSTCRPRGCAAGAAANADAQSISGGSDCSSGSDFVDGVGGKHEISHSQTLFHEHKV